MHLTNPYTQANWGNADASAPLPSIFGALPFASLPRSPRIHEFRFTSFNPNILDCSVIGPKSKPYFRIKNNDPSQNFTLFRNHNERRIAIIEWRRSPGAVVEIRDIIKKQLVSAWLSLSLDQKYRYMNARNRTFVWVPQNGSIVLYSYGTTTPELYAKVSREREGQTVLLEVTSTAIQIGLLECCVVSVVLLQSGRFID